MAVNEPRALSWSDLYQDTPEQIVELDEGGKVLLALIPDDKKPEIEPMLRPMLAQLRIQLGEERYAGFCVDMRRAYQFHMEGNFTDAGILFQAYGIPYDMLITFAQDAAQ